MTTDRPPEIDVELRLIDPKRNAFRLYRLTTTVTLFGERCLRIQWGRIGNRGDPLCRLPPLAGTRTAQFRAASRTLPRAVAGDGKSTRYGA